MIAVAERSSHAKRRPDWQAGFMVLLPDVVHYARRAFRDLDPEARSEAVQDVVVNAMLAYLQLFERGRADLAYPSVLARFAIAQYRDGRRSCMKANCRDVMSPRARRTKGIQVGSLNGCYRLGDPWDQVLVEDRQAGPAETAAARIDFAEWLGSLTRRDRRIAKALAEGSSTTEVARRFRVSPARISQKRREFRESWRSFQGEEE